MLSECMLLETHLSLLKNCSDEDANEIFTSPIFTPAAKKGVDAVFSTKRTFQQYGLLGGDVEGNAKDPRLFYNVSAPSSAFICGSQGSGKSHTLSCLLENCLVPSVANILPNPLTGLVFHYDTFVSEASGNICEAAYLASSKDVRVRVLCAPTNTRNIKVCKLIY